jgi:hypothetical protein
MEIETKNASLDTLAVTILALHVSGKQMTLAVFRQLPQGHEAPNSELWGTVRYQIKDEGYLWLVFSHNGRLYRRALDLSTPRTSKFLINELKISLDRAQQHIINCEKFYGADALTRAQEQAEKIKAELSYEIEMEKESMETQTSRFNNEKRLSQLPQLFIAV